MSNVGLVFGGADYRRRWGAGLRRALTWCLLAASIPAGFAQGAENPTDSDKSIIAGVNNAIVLPEPIPDPIEPVNRHLWSLNQGVLRIAIQPSSKVYRAVVPTDVRRGIRNAGRNLNYPRNVINNLLQQKWIGARDESYRFLCNSVLGVGGFFDVATDYRIPASEADFGQTFRDWGWKPKIYLMLPISGPSNERDATGGFADRMVSPLTYFSPWSYLTLGFMYNNLTDTVDEYIRVAKADYDPYNVLRYAWTIKREGRPVDLSPPENYDVASLETLQSVFFKIRDQKFPEWGEKRHVVIESTGEKLPFTLWLQPREAPLVFVAPGLGSHRLSGSAIAVAEVLYNAGFSAVCVSSPFNHEFMQLAATTPLPGYTPVDARDLHVALTEIDRNIQMKNPNRVTSRALLGYSMGGFYSLFLAGTAQTNNGEMVKFDRYVAVDAPVRLNHAISRLDEHFEAALNWPTEERTARIETTFHKVAALAGKLNTLTPGAPIPLDPNESKFLVGLAFRVTLRDVIFLSQYRTNMGVLNTPINIWRRNPVYEEILQYSFGDYLEKFVVPFYQTRGIDLTDADEFRKAVDLRSHEETLAKNPNVRVIANANDIIINEEELNWLAATFPNRLTVFPRGGHLGNLNETIVQREIVRALSDLLPEDY